MLPCLPDNDIQRFIEEDAPYGDLTTHLLGIGHLPGEISFTTRHDTTLCGTEEAARLLEQCGCTMCQITPSGSSVPPGETFLRASGPASALHTGWKVAANLLEYASGIATRTAGIVCAARTINPQISILTTRKTFPGTKKLAIKAICSGGALPHRLGLSETILVFKQHTTFLGGLDTFLEQINTLKQQAIETKLIVEADSSEEALLIAKSMADVIQIDKIPPAELSYVVQAIRQRNNSIKISATGGINQQNVAAYAASGVDMLVLSSVYFGKPADIGVTIKPCGTNNNPRSNDHV